MGKARDVIFNKFRIESLGGICAKVYIDDVAIGGIQEVSFRMGVNQIPTITITALTDSIETNDIDSVISLVRTSLRDEDLPHLPHMPIEIPNK